MTARAEEDVARGQYHVDVVLVLVHGQMVQLGRATAEVEIETALHEVVEDGRAQDETELSRIVTAQVVGGLQHDLLHEERIL